VPFISAQALNAYGDLTLQNESIHFGEGNYFFWQMRGVKSHLPAIWKRPDSNVCAFALA
jgi:hypothetical protein